MKSVLSLREEVFVSGKWKRLPKENGNKKTSTFPLSSVLLFKQDRFNAKKGTGFVCCILWMFCEILPVFLTFLWLRLTRRAVLDVASRI